MNDYVLFSCVGGHDPVASYADGAILHICRIYKPQRLYYIYQKKCWKGKIWTIDIEKSCTFTTA